MIKKIGIACVAATLLLGCTGNRSDKTGDHLGNIEDGDQVEEASWSVDTASGDLFLLVGTYTSKGGSEGIYLFRFKEGGEAGHWDGRWITPLTSR